MKTYTARIAVGTSRHDERIYIRPINASNFAAAVTTALKAAETRGGVVIEVKEDGR